MFFVCSSMHGYLQPTLTYNAIVFKSSWILTFSNHSCSGPANYHVVFGPYIQTLTDMAATHS